MPSSRRTLLGIATAIPVARATQPAPETIDLWPAAPPGANAPKGPERINAKGSITNIGRPRLVVYRPSRPNGVAMIVVAGGGYAHIELGKESIPASRWLRSRGVTAFELIYRLPREGWPHEAPFQDGQRALRWVRGNARRYGIDPARLGMLGFSAGGHLAGMMAVLPDKSWYKPVDAIDASSARPDFCGLLYPVLTMMPPYDHSHARRSIIGRRPSEQAILAYSVERHVDARTPPCFLAQAADDPISPVENSLMMFAALRRVRVAAELHVFQSGRHGWGMGRPGTEPRAWPALFAHWMAENGWV